MYDQKPWSVTSYPVWCPNNFSMVGGDKQVFLSESLNNLLILFAKYTEVVHERNKSFSFLTLLKVVHLQIYLETAD